VPKDTLTVVDNRTGKSYELPIQDGTIRAADLRQIKASDEDFGLMSYDPAFMNTAACRSAITFIDGDKGILRYRGYPIEQLAERARSSRPPICSSTASSRRPRSWTRGLQVTHHTIIHENIKKFIDGFHHDAHPMGMFVSAVAALSTFYPEAKRIFEGSRAAIRSCASSQKTPTLAAFAHRHSVGMPYAYPTTIELHGQLLDMMFKTTEVKYSPHPVLERPWTSCSSCTPTMSRTARRARCAAWDRHIPIPTPVCRRGCGAVRALARWSKRGSAAHAARDQVDRCDSRLHPACQERRSPVDGLRAPRLQELRSAGPRSSSRLPSRCST